MEQPDAEEPDKEPTEEPRSAEVTDVLLRTGLADGIDTVLELGESYYLAIVYDVPEDLSDFQFQTADGSVTVELDR